MISQTVGLKESAPEIQSVEVNVLDVLRQRGAKTLDQLEGELVHIGSAQLLFAIDRLSRAGRIAIGPPVKGDYLVWAMPEPAVWAGQAESVSRSGF